MQSISNALNGKIISGEAVYISGSNLVTCTSVMNCETEVFIGGKQAQVPISNVPNTDETSLTVTAPILSSGTYDMYVENIATGQKSNTIKVTVE